MPVCNVAHAKGMLNRGRENREALAIDIIQNGRDQQQADDPPSQIGEATLHFFHRSEDGNGLQSTATLLHFAEVQWSATDTWPAHAICFKGFLHSLELRAPRAAGQMQLLPMSSTSRLRRTAQSRFPSQPR